MSGFVKVHEDEAGISYVNTTDITKFYTVNYKYVAHTVYDDEKKLWIYKTSTEDDIHYYIQVEEESYELSKQVWEQLFTNQKIYED